MRVYRLSPQAEQSLVEIITWTIDHFGVNQARRYKNQLIKRLSSLANNEAPHGRPCNILLSNQRSIIDLEYYREGRHYIIFRNSSKGIFVLDFIHSSRNLEQIIQELLKL